MRPEKVFFTNRRGRQLAALLDRPVDGEIRALAVFAHCFTCSKNLKSVNYITQALTQEGIAVFRFDFTGLGESSGAFADTNFTTNIEDVIDAAEFAKSRYIAPEIIIGHSLGGAAVLHAGGKIDSAKALVTIGSPFDPNHVLHHFKECKAEIEEKGEAVIDLGGRKFTFKKQFIEDLEATDAYKAIHNLKKSLLVFHSPTDQTVGIENAAQIFQAAKHPKSFVSLDNADHLLMKESDALYVGTTIAAWAKKYVSYEQQEEGQCKVDNKTIVRSSGDGLKNVINTSGFPLIADEPSSIPGGSNAGPTPYDYLLTALGACTSMTLKMYAKRKKWSLEDVVVTLTHEKIHAQDCEECESEGGMVDLIERQIKLLGDIDDEQRSRLLEIADKCPVHKTLHHEVNIKTELVHD